VAADVKGSEASAAAPRAVRLAIETERKFILHHVPSIERLGPGTHIRQRYLAEDEPVEVRVRITDVAAGLTVKAGAGLSRTRGSTQACAGSPGSNRFSFGFVGDQGGDGRQKSRLCCTSGDPSRQKHHANGVGVRRIGGN